MGSPDQYEDLRRGVREVCADFPDGYWRELDARREYPEDFIEAMTKSGYLGALIPEEYGGLGLSLTETTIILEEINRSGATPSPSTLRCTLWALCCVTARSSRRGSTCRS
ncbi:MAG TPA: acyl-CoA dehydrogenase family protein [Rubrobacter sp.]|nr:acyl-CoA dehydrogenase family protein [Rubrobacter sp.]